MPMTDSEMAAKLAPAGLQFVERVAGDPECLRLVRKYHPATLPPGHPRFDSRPDEVADVDEPGMAGKVNAGWYRMAVEYGLFDAEREFLLSVDFSVSEAERFRGEHRCWVRVRLLEDWDLAGSRVAEFRSAMAGPLTRRYVPEFRMVSLDGRMMLNTTVWGNGTVSTIVVRP